MEDRCGLCERVLGQAGGFSRRRLYQALLLPRSQYVSVCKFCFNQFTGSKSLRLIPSKGNPKPMRRNKRRKGLWRLIGR